MFEGNLRLSKAYETVKDPEFQKTVKDKVVHGYETAKNFVVSDEVDKGHVYSQPTEGQRFEGFNEHEAETGLNGHSEGRMEFEDAKDNIEINVTDEELKPEGK